MAASPRYGLPSTSPTVLRFPNDVSAKDGAADSTATGTSAPALECVKGTGS